MAKIASVLTQYSYGTGKYQTKYKNYLRAYLVKLNPPQNCTKESAKWIAKPCGYR